MVRLFITALLLLAFCAPARATNFGVPVDKAAHFGLSYALTDQLVRLGFSPEEALGATLFIGWAKEVSDHPPDPADFAADAAGALLAAYGRWTFAF